MSKNYFYRSRYSLSNGVSLVFLPRDVDLNSHGQYFKILISPKRQELAQICSVWLLWMLIFAIEWRKSRLSTMRRWEVIRWWKGSEKVMEVVGTGNVNGAFKGGEKKRKGDRYGQKRKVKSVYSLLWDMFGFAENVNIGNKCEWYALFD